MGYVAGWILYVGGSMKECMVCVQCVPEGLNCVDGKDNLVALHAALLASFLLSLGVCACV